MKPSTFYSACLGYFMGGCLGLLVACTGKPKPYPPHDFHAQEVEDQLVRQDRDRWFPDQAKPFHPSKAPTVYFSFDSAELTQEAREVLQALPPKPCTCEGHASEEGETAYNLALGAARARTVSAYLATARGIPQGPVISYGEERPYTYSPAEAHLNRRVEVYCP